jgi:hypothetical protein
MSRLASILVSAAMGSAVGLAAMVAAALGGLIWSRWTAGAAPASLRGSGWRMVAAVAGVTLGVLLDPPSWPAYAVSFLMVYLSGNGILMLRFGPGAGRS